MTEYRPGVCNIGRTEQRTRLLTGLASLVGALAVVWFVVATGRPDLLVLASFPLFLGASVGVVQWRLRFCVGFGLLGRYDLTGSGGDAGTVDDREAVRRDRRRIVTVLAYATGLAAVPTAAAYVVATLV